MLVEKADLLTLSVPEMTALVGGMRALNANIGQTFTVFTDKRGTLSNDFFNQPAGHAHGVVEVREDRRRL